MIGLSNDYLYLKLVAQVAAKLWAVKVGGKKIFRPFGFEATFFASLYSESLLSERFGFESRQAQTLRADSFAAPWPTGLKIVFIEDLIFIY